MDEDVDTCEYVWNTELAMRRLLAMLRNGQAYCTDGECFDVADPNRSTGGSAVDADSPASQMFMWFTMIVLAVMLVAFRPNGAGRRSIGAAPADKPASQQPPRRPDEGPDPPALQ